jgi:transcriptional regulator with XRE-family HTH domain
VAQRVSGTASQQDILLRFGQAVRARRGDLRLSQEELAHLSGIDRSHMGKIERGERNVTLLNIERVAVALQTTPSKLLSEAGY